jgi:hypothetical protein
VTDDQYTQMPFVLTQEHGGEYETEAFIAGWHLGVLDARITIADMAGLIMPPIALKLAWREQIDLIAMARGLLVEVTPLESRPEYAVYTFIPESQTPESDEL